MRTKHTEQSLVILKSKPIIKNLTLEVSTRSYHATKKNPNKFQGFVEMIVEFTGQSKPVSFPIWFGKGGAETRWYAKKEAIEAKEQILADCELLPIFEKAIKRKVIPNPYKKRA